METLTRPHKHPVTVGDHVSVTGTALEQGWRSARLLRFTSGGTIAVVTKPNHAGVRHVGVARITKQHQP